MTRNEWKWWFVRILLVVAGFCFARYLTGCAPAGTRPVNDFEWDTIVETIVRWESEGLPSPSAECWDRFEGTGIYRAETQADFYGTTGGWCQSQYEDPCPSDMPNGYANAQARYGYFADYYFLMIIAEPIFQAEDERVLRRVVSHETVHFLGLCTGIGSDPNHSEPYWSTVVIQVTEE